jgi:hypothetical protein
MSEYTSIPARSIPALRHTLVHYTRTTSPQMWAAMLSLGTGGQFAIPSEWVHLPTSKVARSRVPICGPIAQRGSSAPRVQCRRRGRRATRVRGHLRRSWCPRVTPGWRVPGKPLTVAPGVLRWHCSARWSGPIGWPS